MIKQVSWIAVAGVAATQLAACAGADPREGEQAPVGAQNPAESPGSAHASTQKEQTGQAVEAESVGQSQDSLIIGAPIVAAPMVAAPIIAAPVVAAPIVAPYGFYGAYPYAYGAYPYGYGYGTMSYSTSYGW